MASFEGVLASIPGYGGYLAKRQYNQEQDANALRQITGVLSLQHALNTQPLQEQALQQQVAQGAAMNPLLLQAERQKIAQTQQQQDLLKGVLNGGSSGALNDPNTLRALGVALDKPAFITHAEYVDRQNNAAAQLPLMQSTPQGLPAGSAVPGTNAVTTADIPPQDMAAFQKVAQATSAGQKMTAAPTAGDPMTMGGGVFDTFSGSESPAIAARGKQLSSMVNNPAFKATPQNMDALTKEADRLTQMQATYDQQKALYGQRERLAAQSDATRRIVGGVGTPETGGVSPGVENVAQLIAEYKQAPLSSFAMGRPLGAQIMSRVKEINPSYDAKNYTVGLGTERAFTSGKQGNTIRSFNVALNHLDTLGQLADALNNNNLQLVNKVANTVAAQTGSAAPTNFNAAKKIVGDEIVKAIIGSGGGVTDRQEAAATISAANSPKQLKEAIDVYKQLMSGQLQGLHQQYKAGGGTKDFNSFLSEEAQGQAATSSAPISLDQYLKSKGH